QGEAVGRHAAAYAHANRGELSSSFDPDASEAVDPFRIDAEARRGRNDRRLERSHVAAQVERVAQLDDGIGDQLARAVEGDVAAAIDAQEGRAQLAQPLWAGDQVRGVPAAADGVDREMLQQQQAVTDAPLSALSGKLVLQLPGGLVRYRPQAIDRQC